MKIINIIGSTWAGKTEALNRIVWSENIFSLQDIKNKVTSQTCIGIDDVRDWEIPDDISEFLTQAWVTHIYLASESISNKWLYKNTFEKITTGETISFVALFNIDWVLTNLNGWSEYDTRDVLKYEPHWDMIFMLKAMRSEWLKMIFTTTRPESLRAETLAWIEAHEMLGKNDELFMRAKSDEWADITIEYNRLKSLAKIHNIMLIFCARNDFTNMYRQSGFRVMQVCDNSR